MEYDSSSTDDDFLPPLNHFSRGVHADAGRGSVFRVHNEMDSQIHLIEKEAYCSILRAFKAQSDSITWEQESLMTELRKELRVSDDEHRDLLSSVNGDDMIGRIREWRLSGLQAGWHSGARHDNGALAIPTISGSLKRQKSSPSVSRGMKHKQFSNASFAERTKAVNRGSYGALASNECTERAAPDPYVGKKVWTRWPEDDHFYEAMITQFDPLKGKHLLGYDMHAAHETWEWVDLKEISPEDIRWECEEPGPTRKSVYPGSGRGFKRPVTCGRGLSGAGRGRVISNVLSAQPQNDTRKKAPGSIELLRTQTLIKEVEKIFNACQPDLLEIQKAKRVLKEQEQTLVDAIAMLEDISDDESDGERRHCHSQGLSIEQS